jgi:lipopolysaccharide assembly outer membrane protein LptD (OstA)
MGSGALAQQAPFTYENDEVTFSGDKNITSTSTEVIELTGNVKFSSSIVEIEKADKIIYDRKTKTFTVSGFKELRLNGKTKLASDLGETTLKVEFGDCVAYLVANQPACADGKGKGC